MSVNIVKRIEELVTAKNQIPAEFAIIVDDVKLLRAGIGELAHRMKEMETAMVRLAKHGYECFKTYDPENCRTVFHFKLTKGPKA